MVVGGVRGDVWIGVDGGSSREVEEGGGGGRGRERESDLVN